MIPRISLHILTTLSGTVFVQQAPTGQWAAGTATAEDSFLQRRCRFIARRARRGRVSGGDACGAHLECPPQHSGREARRTVACRNRNRALFPTRRQRAGVPARPCVPARPADAASARSPSHTLAGSHQHAQDRVTSRTRGAGALSEAGGEKALLAPRRGVRSRAHASVCGRRAAGLRSPRLSS